MLNQNVYFLLILFLFSCSQPENTEQDKAEIQNNWTSFKQNWEAENAPGCVAFYTEEAINVPPEFSIRKGKEEIQSFYEMLFSNNLSSDYTHESISLEITKDHAIEFGNMTVDWTRNDSTTWTYYARTLTHWKKNKAGDWKIDKFLFNNPPGK